MISIYSLVLAGLSIAASLGGDKVSGAVFLTGAFVIAYLEKRK